MLKKKESKRLLSMSPLQSGLIGQRLSNDCVSRYSSLTDTPVIYPMGKPIALPLVFKQDTDTYILDQLLDPTTGVINMNVFLKLGTYNFVEVFKSSGFKPKNDDVYAPAHQIIVDHSVSPENSTTALSVDDLPVGKVSLSSTFTDLLKEAPKIVGHVIDIATTIASFFAVQNTDVVTETSIRFPLLSLPINGPVSYFSVHAHDIGTDMKGLHLCTYTTDTVTKYLSLRAKDPLISLPLAKYVIPVISWLRK